MKKIFYSLLLLLGLLVVSCTSKKELVYLSNLDPSSTEEFFDIEFPEYKIQKTDILYIRFYTLNQELNDVLNVGSTRYTSNIFTNETSIYIFGYTINDSGNIILPIIGEIPVLGLTIDEATRVIQERSNTYMKDVSVSVKLINFKFTVIGEVNKPGSYINYNNQLTVLEAIGMAGDISDYGNRQKVLVVRPSPEGTKTYKINLQDKALLKSEAFFLLPNDIVIVEPIKSKPFQLNIPTMALFLSTISTLILILSFVNN